MRATVPEASWPGVCGSCMTHSLTRPDWPECMFEQRLVALVEELADDALQHRVLAGLGDALVEQPVAARRHAAGIDLLLHQRERVAQPGDLRFLHVARGMCGELGLDQLARADGL